MLNRMLATCLALSLFIPQVSIVRADDTFISLTRSPEQMSKLPVNISALTKADIEKLGVTNLPDVLRFLPGVKIEGGGSQGAFSKIKLRGVPTANQVQIVIDDQPLGGTSVQNIDAALIPLEDVERIEVVRGGAGNLYGANTIGGVIHVITKKASQSRAGSMAYEGQSFNTNIHTTQVEAKEGITDAMVTYRRMESNGYQDDAQVDQEYVSANTGLTFSNGARVAFQYSDMDQDQGLPSGTPVRFEDWNGDRERASNGANSTIDKDSRRVRNQIEVPLGFVKFQNSAAYSSDKRETITPFFLSKSLDEIWSNDSRFTFTNGFTAGFAYERDQREALNQDPHHITNIAGYANQELNAGKWLFIPAVRVEQHSLFGTQCNPNLSVVFTQNDALKFSATAARAVRAPTITDLYEDFPDAFGVSVYDFNSNPDLQPEIAQTYDLGFELKPAEKVTFTAAGFYSHIKDRITAVDSDGALDFFGNTTEDTLANTAKAEISGAETGLHFQTGFLSHSANYTYQRAKGTSATSTTFHDIQFTPRHIANYTLNADLTHGAYLLNTLQYVSRQYSGNNRTGVVLHPYAVWNAKLEKKWQILSAFVGVDNIANRLYGESVTFGNPVPQPTRTFRAGAKMAFGQ